MNHWKFLISGFPIQIELNTKCKDGTAYIGVESSSKDLRSHHRREVSGIPGLSFQKVRAARNCL
jgi:hypothetical protein